MLRSFTRSFGALVLVGGTLLLGGDPVGSQSLCMNCNVLSDICRQGGGRPEAFCSEGPEWRVICYREGGFRFDFFQACRAAGGGFSASFGQSSCTKQCP